MTPLPPPPKAQRRLPLVSGVVLLAFALVGGLWAASHFSAEARVRRATARIVRLVQKPGPEAPVSLGLSANRLGRYLAVDAVLELEGHGALATGRKEIVQFYAQVRNSFRQIEFSEPKIAVGSLRGGEVQSSVDARHRLVDEGGRVLSGDGKASLHWLKGEEGWQIDRASLRPDPATSIPKDWL